MTEPQVVDTNNGKADGQVKCPSCGSTDISTNIKTGMLRCNFCRFEFAAEKASGFVEDITKLTGQVIGSGAQDIKAAEDAAQNMITLKCQSCGAEVVIDSSEATQARCHWCRNTLSLNSQLPNGAIPDVVLPFGVTKEEAKTQIEAFVKKRQFFAHPKFKAEFTTENIMGVYFPYMLVDVNAHATLSGTGEHQTRCYTVGTENNRHTVYDADVYHVERDFDIYIKGLSIESNSDRANSSAKGKTNNVINSIMPFDTENCVCWNANYLKGFTSERRDTNIDDLQSKADIEAKDIARFAANESLSFYDRGVAWSNEQLSANGQQWRAAYLPVWLYSYQQIKGNESLLHYVAVNARTKETMGSVPIHYPKLLALSALVEAGGVALTIVGAQASDYSFIFLLTGPIFFLIFYLKYRNTDKRHHHETETEKQLANLKHSDTFVKSVKGVRNAQVAGCNNTCVGQQSMGNQVLNAVVDPNIQKIFKK